MKCYRIKDFALNFLRSDLKRDGKRAPQPPLSWLGCRTSFDGGGFHALAEHPNGTTVFGAFILMAQISAKTNLKGLLANKDGPFSTKDMHKKTGHPIENFDLALNVLQDKEIGWVDTVEFETVSGCFRMNPDESGQNTAQQSTSEKTTAEPAAPTASVAAAEFENRGIDGITASWANGKFTSDIIRHALTTFDARSSRERIENPAGLLRVLLEKGCTPPKVKKPKETKIGVWP